MQEGHLQCQLTFYWIWLFYGQDNKAKLGGAVWPHYFMASELPCYAECKAGIKGGGSLFVCVWVCACICQAKKRKRSWKKTIPIKIVHKTIKLLCAHRPCGSDCTSHSSLCLPLASSTASSLLWSLPFLFTGLTLLWVYIHKHLLCVCFLLLSVFPSLPGYHLDFDLDHRLAHPFSLSCFPFAEPIPLFLWVSSIAYFLTFPHTKTSSHTLTNQDHLVLSCSL